MKNPNINISKYKEFCMTVWVFGDSYAQVHEKYLGRENESQWMQQVADGMNETLECLALAGSSQTYTYYKFHSVRHLIKENDTIIICPTNLGRRWFFRDRPGDAGLELKASTKEKGAIKKYRIYLDSNNILDEIHFIDFLYNLHYLTEKKNLKTIIVHCFMDAQHIVESNKEEFPLFCTSIGNLYDVNEYECFDTFYKMWINLPFDKIGDPRLNHLIRSNHDILAKKILDHLQTGKEIDLTQGFIQRVINFDTKFDEDFCNKEFFGNPWIFGL